MIGTAERIAVTGGTGFVGQRVVRQLLATGYSKVTAIGRHPPEKLADTPGLAICGADLTDPNQVQRALAGCSAVIHLVGIIRPTSQQTFYQAHVATTQNLITAMPGLGIKRLVHMSAMGTRSGAVSAYHQTKWQAEAAVAASGLDYTIIRPSLILGEGGEFAKMLDGWARGRAPPFLFMPYFGRGAAGQKSSQIAPVSVDDVAKLFVLCLAVDASVGKTYELSGPRVFNWPEFLRCYALAKHSRKRRAIGIPAWWGKILGRLPGMPFTRDQVIMAVENDVGDGKGLLSDFPDFRTRQAF